MLGSGLQWFKSVTKVTYASNGDQREKLAPGFACWLSQRIQAPYQKGCTALNSENHIKELI